jgi:hypothetical protein
LLFALLRVWIGRAKVGAPEDTGLVVEKVG